MTVGIDETATMIGVRARSKGDTSYSLDIPVKIIDHMHSITLVPATPKTCTTDGNIEHFKCNVCGDLFADAGGVNSLTEEDIKIPAGHEYGDLVPKQEPTCKETGMQAYYKCSVCNEYFDESKTEKTVTELTISIDPNAHDFGAWIAEVPATCVATGTKGHKDCNRCNRHYDESGNEITDLTIQKNDNHDWNAWVSNGDGTHTRTCKRDGGHKENGTCSGGAATCTTKAVCDVCRTEYGETAPHNTTQYGGKDSSGHWDTCSTCDNKLNFEAHTPDRENADETNPVKCTKCDFVIAPVLGHIHNTTFVDEVGATCMKEGSKSYYKCSGCEVKFEDKEATKPITDESTLVIAKAHKFGAWIDEVSATEEKEGTKGHKDCSVCGKHFDKDGNEITELRIAKIGTPAKKDGLSGGQIAGIVIGSVAVAGIGGFAVLWFAVKKKTFADLGVALKKGFTAIGNFFKNLGAKIKTLFTKKK